MSSADAKKSRIDQYLALLRASLQPPPAFFKSANDMTKTEARDMCLHYLAWGAFDLKNRDAMFTLDRNGDLQPPTPEQKFWISPARINGVDFRYVLKIDKKGGKKTGIQEVGHLDVRNLVFLTKLAAVLRWMGATTIYHIGFLFGPERVDCHGQGRACDFAGAAGDGWDVTVAEHWAAQPVTMPKDWRSPKNNKSYKMGTVLPDWPEGFSDTVFRLDANLNPNLDPSKNPELARQVFQAVYDFSVLEGSDTANGVTSSIGGRSDVMHPDHPASHPGKSNGREAHWQHMHMQVGPTGKE